MKRVKIPTLLFILLAFLVGCAGVPVRETVKVDLNFPIGRIEGNQFTGNRFPFKISVPPHWKMTTEFPDFLEEMGYGRPGENEKEPTELYLFNPKTHSSLQVDFTPADQYVTFSQVKIEAMTGLGAGCLVDDLEEAYGKDIKVEIGPTGPLSLKGVQFAAKKYATYTVEGVKREQGWIYAFNEPYQIFILYMIVGNEGNTDRQDIKKILDSFEVTSMK
ncbi:MAG: hypothetical protein COZ69_01330 [Deltaproteobacteria bacterium CG_4_8_14_3_um_filter_45_9]|nr:MAG: hypothetical protein COS40_06705 [Deltaproteobacteria bacterium CG03_land_8_20_14_0_80_45_14]PIX26163.1 MAG: hypothetical protein COZ69_01330 [Deltaproteobacteria bacterium CG_4_8_14_3_um_filter_45_9]